MTRAVGAFCGVSSFYDGCRLNHWVFLVINPGAEMIYYVDSLPGGRQDYEDVKTKFMKWVLILLIYNWHKFDYWMLLLIWSWFNFGSALCICCVINPKSKSKSSKIQWIEIKVFSNQWYFFDNVINGIFNSLCGINFNYVFFF